MTARVVLLSEVKRERDARADKGAAYKDYCLRQGHSSVRAFERAMDNDEYARLCREFGGDVGRHAADFLRQTQEVQRWNAAFLIHLAAMAGTIAAHILKNTADLLHRASVLTANNLSREVSECRRTLARTDAQQTTQQLSDPR